MDATNSLRVSFQTLAKGAVQIPMAQAHGELAPFGEIARLELPTNMPLTALVSFYDVRAASAALAALGNRCSIEPQHGNRTVVLHGDVQLETWMIEEIQTIQRGESGATYMLFFFDTRAAERAALVLDEHAAASCKNLDDERPRCRNDLRLSQVNWADLASGRETRTTLRLRCVPRKLCNERAFQSMLARAGLSEVVDCVRVFPAEAASAGNALINAIDTAGVIAVAKYFHGRHWGRSMPVTVSFAAVQGADEVRTAPAGPLCTSRC